MITKNELVLDAYEEMRVSGLTVTPSPGEVTSAIKKMDSMILSWQNKGLCFGYVKSAGYNDIDPTQDSGVSDSDAFAIVYNLAKTLCPMYGKQADRETKVNAKVSYEGLFSPELTTREQTPYLPRGAGGSSFYGSNIGGYCLNYFQTFEKNAPDYCTTKDIITGQIEFFGIDFNLYLNKFEGDTIASFIVEDGQGVKVLESAELNGFINIKAQDGAVGNAPVLITITTTSGRVLPETVSFNVIAY